MTEYKIGDHVQVLAGRQNEGAIGVVIETTSANVYVMFENHPDLWYAYEDVVKLHTEQPAPAPDPVAHPPHYTAHPSGIECIQVTEHMSFLLGNTIKYIWRADLKQDAIEDLKKARWYLDREIQKRETA